MTLSQLGSGARKGGAEFLTCDYHLFSIIHPFSLYISFLFVIEHVVSRSTQPVPVSNLLFGVS